MGRACFSGAPGRSIPTVARVPGAVGAREDSSRWSRLRGGEGMSSQILLLSKKQYANVPFVNRCPSCFKFGGTDCAHFAVIAKGNRIVGIEAIL